MIILSECISRTEHERVIRDLNELTTKYREVLQKQILIVSVIISVSLMYQILYVYSSVRVFLVAIGKRQIDFYVTK